MFDSLMILFVSIVLEALPFVFLGTLIASVIHVFVTPERIQKAMPRHPFLRYLFAGSLGFVIPVCECVSVPLLKQLLNKGFPLGAGITFMASAPIVNPLVIAATRFAFSGTPEVFWFRIVGGFVGAIVVGWLFGLIYKKTDGKALPKMTVGESFCEHHDDSDRLRHGISHFLKEFTTICGYLIVGAFLASVAKTLVPIAWINSLSSTLFLEIILLQLLAFVLSLCSEADAFIARTFQGMFSDSAILGFLLFGPMIDFKNAMMLRVLFSRKYIALLTLIIALVTGLISFLFFSVIV